MNPTTEKLPPVRRKERELKTAYSTESVDIANFVLEVDRFAKLIEPFALILFILDDIRKWKLPIISCSLWIFCNIACLVLSKGATFALVSLMVSLIFAGSLFHIHTRILDKMLPTTEKQVYSSGDIDVDSLNTVKEFRYSLIQVYDFIEKCNEYMAQFYSLLKWDNLLSSLRFHIEVCSFFLCLVIFPASWICFLFTNWFFVGCEEIMRKGSIKINRMIEKWTGKSLSHIIPVSSEPCETSLKKEEIYEEDFGDQIDSKADDPDEKQGMVSKFFEVRQRKENWTKESCFACDATFSSFLKKRYYCRHCGNNFCSKCCNQKVPRSLFGATAPAAQTETVLVCNVCHKLLTDEEKTQEGVKDKDS